MTDRAQEIEARLLQRIAVLSHADAGTPPTKIHVHRDDYQALCDAGYAGRCTGQVRLPRGIGATLVLPFGRDGDKQRRDD